MPEASKSNIHGHTHGRTLSRFYNTGGVEEDTGYLAFIRYADHLKHSNNL